MERRKIISYIIIGVFVLGGMIATLLYLYDEKLILDYTQESQVEELSSEVYEEKEDIVSSSDEIISEKEESSESSELDETIERKVLCVMLEEGSTYLFDTIDDELDDFHNDVQITFDKIEYIGKSTEGYSIDIKPHNSRIEIDDNGIIQNEYSYVIIKMTACAVVKHDEPIIKKYPINSFQLLMSDNMDLSEDDNFILASMYAYNSDDVGLLDYGAPSFIEGEEREFYMAYLFEDSEIEKFGDNILVYAAFFDGSFTGYSEVPMISAGE